MSSAGDSWDISQSGSILQIAYGSGTDFPQYAALHLDSSYFRLSYGPTSGWGTSVILLPAFWSRGRYCQGAPVDVRWHEEGSDLVLVITGSICNLDVSQELRLSPPRGNTIEARVTTIVQGSVSLDRRPGEAFKPVMLSSMRISPTVWDTPSAYLDCQYFPIPQEGWIIPPQPAVIGRIFGLRGGTSDWKSNAPTIEITLDQPLQIAGWVTPSGDPNDDNVGYWAASDQLIDRWIYTIRAEPFPSACRTYLTLVTRR